MTPLLEPKSASEQLEDLKGFIRLLYNDAVSCVDARDFAISTQEQLEDLIRSWGETPMTPAEYMEAQQRAELERLPKILEEAP